MESASGGRSGAPSCFCNRPRMAAERSPALPPYWSVPCQGRLMKPLGLGSVSLHALFLPPWRRPSASLQARAPITGAAPPEAPIRPADDPAAPAVCRARFPRPAPDCCWITRTITAAGQNTWRGNAVLRLSMRIPCGYGLHRETAFAPLPSRPAGPSVGPRFCISGITGSQAHHLVRSGIAA